MKYCLYASAFAMLLAGSAQAEGLLTVTSEAIDDQSMIAPDYAFCVPADKSHMKEGPDKSPALSWKDAPTGTQSFAITMVDPDVPADFSNGNKEGKTITAGTPRRDFFHWVLVNIPATTTSLAAGADSNGPSKNGKSELQMSYGLRGINDYTAFMASNAAHKGTYAGYDGPCPPWNDKRMHHYHFTVYALDIPKLDLPEHFTGWDATKALADHVLARGEIVGYYTLNPSLMPPKKK